MVKTRAGASTRRESDVVSVEKLPSPEPDDFSDDDAPVEVTSKKPKFDADIALVEDEPVEKSLFEQIQEQKKEEEDRKKEKSKARRVKRKKIDEGTFSVKVKKAEFKVVALDKGVVRSLEPERNYKADLLEARTVDRRIKGNVNQLAHRVKWASKR